MNALVRIFAPGAGWLCWNGVSFQDWLGTSFYEFVPVANATDASNRSFVLALSDEEVLSAVR